MVNFDYYWYVHNYIFIARCKQISWFWTRILLIRFNFIWDFNATHINHTYFSSWAQPTLLRILSAISILRIFIAVIYGSAILLNVLLHFVSDSWMSLIIIVSINVSDLIIYDPLPRYQWFKIEVLTRFCGLTSLRMSNHNFYWNNSWTQNDPIVSAIYLYSINQSVVCAS